MDHPWLRRRWPWFLGLAAGLALFVAACGESSSTPAPIPSEVTPTSAAATATPAPTAAQPTTPVATPTTASTSRPTPTPTAAPSPTPSSSGAPLRSVDLEDAFPRLPQGVFGDRPLFATSPPDGSNRVAVVEQGGRIFVLPNDPQATRAQVFLDISPKVSRQGNEEGLLGLAFHPRYAENGLFYVYYSAAPGPRRTVLSRFKISADPNKADPSSETVLVEVQQPFSNHKGGMLAFGPDGFLYIGLGDGGSGGDPFGNGQSLKTLLAKVLRIDVDRQSGGLPYAIPPDNPFAGPGAPAGARGEVWAYGMRNPWRFSFDPAGTLWVADVGQNEREEIDLVRKGGNYGWNIMEGSQCFQPRANCSQQGLELPLFDYGHDLGCSITGGYVYRGSRVPWLRGAYVYGDFCSGRIWALRAANGRVVEQKEIARTRLNISSFGEDASGELFVVAFDGRLYRLRDAG